MMTDLCWACGSTAPWACRRSKSGRLRLPAPNAPIRRKSRRETPSQKRRVFCPRRVSITAPSSTEQTLNHVTLAEAQRSAELIGQLGVSVNSQRMINRGDDVGRANGVFGWITRLTVGLAEDKASSDSGPGQDRRIAATPM